MQRLVVERPDLRDAVRPPASEADLDRLEALVGASLPGELRELYRQHDGQTYDGPGFFLDWMWLPVADVEREIRGWREQDEAAFDEADENLVSDTAGAVSEVYWNPMWLPVASDGGGNFLVVDLAPGPAGTRGQVVNAGRDEELRFVLGNSLGEFLERMNAWLTGGLDRVWGDHHGALDWFLAPFDPALAALAPVSNGGRPDLQPPVGPSAPMWSRSIRSRLSFPDYSSLALSPRLKQATIWPPEPLADLTVLPPLAELRKLNVVTRSLAGIERLPSLTQLILPIQTPVIDLAPLAGAPALRELWCGVAGRDAEILPRLGKLVSLRVRMLDGAAPAVLAGCRDLVRLHVDATGVGATQLTFDGQHALRSLSVSHASGLSLDSLAGSSPLRHVSLEFCPGVDLSPLATCAGLRSLSLQDCPDQRGVEALRQAIQLRDIQADYGMFVALRDHLPQVPWTSMTGDMTDVQMEEWRAYLASRRSGT